MRKTLPPQKPLPGFSPHHMFMRTPSRCTANRSGFTLIELLVVISIIAILTVIGIVSYATVQKNVRDARRKIDINYIGQAIEATYNPGGNSYNFSGETNIPKDPLDGNNSSYRYWYSNTSDTGASTGVIIDTLGTGTTITINKYFVCAPMEVIGSGNSTCSVVVGTPGVLTKATTAALNCYCQVSKQKQ